MSVSHEQDTPYKPHYQDGPTLESGTESVSSTRPPQYNKGNLASSELSFASAGLPELLRNMDLDDDDYVHIPPSFTSGETATSEETVRLRPAVYESVVITPPLFPLNQDNLNVHCVIAKPRSNVQIWLHAQSKLNTAPDQVEKRDDSVSVSVKPPASRVSLSDQGSYVDVRTPATDSMDVAGAGTMFDNVVFPTDVDLDFDTLIFSTDEDLNFDMQRE